MATENNLDAKQEEASSSSDANSGAASSAAADANQAQSTKDFAELAVEALQLQHPSLKPSEPSTEATDLLAQAAEGAINKSNKTEDQSSQETVAKPDAASVKDEDLPFHKHERFQELKKERDEFKTAAETAKPQIERLSVIEQFMSANRITPEQFKQVLEIQALVNSSPEQALERLQPLIAHLQAFKGLVLPPDLKTEVEAGTLSQERAQEIAKLRKGAEFKEQQSQVQTRETEAERLMTALSSWEETIRRTDPDYERKKNFVLNRFVALSASNPWRTPDQAIALSKRAYDEVNSELGVFVPKPKPTRSPPTNGHSSAAKPAFTSWDQAEDMAIEHVRFGPRRR